MMPRTCGECTSIQHVFFRTQDEYDTWECPECKEKVEEIEDNPEPETES
jgi:hypothetical protein